MPRIRWAMILMCFLANVLTSSLLKRRRFLLRLKC